MNKQELKTEILKKLKYLYEHKPSALNADYRGLVPTFRLPDMDFGVGRLVDVYSSIDRYKCVRKRSLEYLVSNSAIYFSKGVVPYVTVHIKQPDNYEEWLISARMEFFI